MILIEFVKTKWIAIFTISYKVKCNWSIIFIGSFLPRHRENYEIESDQDFDHRDWKVESSQSTKIDDYTVSIY